MVNNLSAVSAYQKALEANKKIQASLALQTKTFPTAILRKGDDLTVLQTHKPEKVQTFGDVLKQELVNNPIKTISSANKTMFEVAQAEGEEMGPNLVALVEAVDKAQVTINTIVTIRDRIISAYQEMMRMPI